MSVPGLIHPSGDDAAEISAAEDGLRQALALVERAFDVEVEELLGWRPGSDDIVRYYTQSLAGYLLVHCRRGAIHFALDGDGFAAQARIVARYLHPDGPKRVLELASGLGFNAVRLARLLAGAQVTGIDLTPWHVRLARLRATHRTTVRFERGDFERLPFGSQAFDGVYVVEAFCYTRDLRAGLAEVARVLRPGGRFVLIENRPERALSTLSPEQRTAVRLLDSAFAISDTWTVPDLLAAGEQIGLRLVASEDLKPRVLQDVDRIARFARYWLERPRRARAVDRRVSARLVPNVIATFLLPHVMRSDALGYRLVVLER